VFILWFCGAFGTGEMVDGPDLFNCDFFVWTVVWVFYIRMNSEFVFYKAWYFGL